MSAGEKRLWSICPEYFLHVGLKLAMMLVGHCVGCSGLTAKIVLLMMP
jgi:hypothetical protein